MLLLCFVTVLSFLASFGAKMLVSQFVVQRIPLIGSFAGIERSTNAGIAFGITFPVIIQAFLTGLALVFVLVLAWRWARSTLSQVAFGLILGSIAVAAALAFGLGGRSGAGRLVDEWVDRKALPAPVAAEKPAIDA